jgi:hypothetical protein
MAAPGAKAKELPGVMIVPCVIYLRMCAYLCFEVLALGLAQFNFALQYNLFGEWPGFFRWVSQRGVN